MKRQTRRQFVKSTGALGAALLAPHIGARGANETIRVAVCGVNSQGWDNSKGFQQLEGVEVVAFCDPDRAILDRRIADFAKEFPDAKKLDGHTNYKEVLDRSDIDAVVVATPNHWHSLIGIHACEAGKDAYVQKPISHTIWEGRQLVNAKNKYNRIVQTGTQNRSDGGLLKFYPYLHSGELGKIKMIHGLCYRNRASIGKLDKALVPPKSCDYNLWLGPAQDEPLYRPQFHYDWHWDFNTGNGDIGNQGPHEMDLIRWALGDKDMPTRVTSFGGRFAWNDAGNTANMQVAAYEWGDVPVYFEVRNLWATPDRNAAPSYMGGRVGVVIRCENGYFVGGRGGGWVYDNDGKRVKQFPGDGGGDHFGNFIEAMRSRDESTLRAPAQNGHNSAALSHLANISYRLGKNVTPGELNERMRGDAGALDSIERFTEQMAAWNVDYQKEPWQMGVSLAYDGNTEKFSGAMSDDANKMLHRKDRAGFEVPEVSKTS